MPENAGYIEQKDAGKYVIQANTNTTGYKIVDNFKWGQSEIKYINLGLEIREQPEMSLAKDVNRVKLTINGNEHTYIYNERFTNKDPANYFNVGVKYFDTDNKKYARPIYESDYKYINKQDQSKELKVYITYELKMGNISSSLTTKVNSIVDYFDSRFNLESAGTELKENGDTNGNIVPKEGESITQNGRTYKKVELDNKHTDKITSQESQSIYVQFSITKDQVKTMIEEDNRGGTDVLYNIAEINSYSVYDGESGNVYAGIDKKSNPGNCTPGDSNTYQNDTDMAPDIDLTVAERRTLEGLVFEDNPEVEGNEDSRGIMTGKIRQGNGEYEANETRIGGITVTLKEKKENGMIYRTKTAEEESEYYQITQKKKEGQNEEEPREYEYEINKCGKNDENAKLLKKGEFCITDFIPGDYEVIYEWGDKTYQVQNYKGTVYDSTRNEDDEFWYKKDIETRKTDAKDDWITRENIDKEIQKITKDTKDNIKNAYNEENVDNNNKPITIKQMQSTTPKMKIRVELTDDKIENVKDITEGKSVDYKVKNIDFGIIERAKQHLVLDKYIYKMKVTLANSHVIADLTRNEKTKKLEGESKGVTHMLPQPGIQPANGFAKLELDNELMQGTKLEVTYKIEAINKSEKDYVNKEFYLYGTPPQNDKDIVRIQPTNIVDYLDKGWAVDTETYKNEETTWDIKTMETENLDGSKTIIKEWVKEETVYKYLQKTIGSQTILNTKQMSNKKLEPEESAYVELNASRVLSTVTDEISLNNHTEEIEVNKTGGRDIETIPGDTVPEIPPPTGPIPGPDFDTAETVIVTPATGLNLNYIIPIAIGVTALIILGVGVIIIKKKAI